MTARHTRRYQDRHDTQRLKRQADREAPVAVILIGLAIVLFFGALFGPPFYFLVSGQIVDAFLFGLPWLVVFGLVTTVLGGG